MNPWTPKFSFRSARSVNDRQTKDISTRTNKEIMDLLECTLSMEPFSQLYTYYVILYLEIYQDIGYKNISVGRTFSSILENFLIHVVFVFVI